MRGKSERPVPQAAHLGISANVAAGKDLSGTGQAASRALLCLVVEAPQVLTSNAKTDGQ